MSSQASSKPENALKRAEELLALGYKQNALNTLAGVVTNKKNKTWTRSIEKLTMMFLELCVDLRRSDLAKDGLYMYKSTSQQVPTSLELVIQHFLQKAREATDEAIQKAAIAGAAIDHQEVSYDDDLSADQLQSVTGEGSKERNERIVDREIVIPWLRFMWETYKTVLETLKQSTKLEHLYKSTAEQTFAFCLKHKRTAEFKRLNDLLKIHLTALKTSALNPLDNPDTFHTQLEIRLTQLNTASKLELWQEAFKTVEEINSMVTPPSRVPPTPMMITYYEKLAQIFWVSENFIFHTHALRRYYQILSPAAEGAEPRSAQELPTQVLLAALSIPVPSGISNHRSVQLQAFRQHVPLSVFFTVDKHESTSIDSGSVDALMSDGETNQAERLAKASSMYGFTDLEQDRDTVLHNLVRGEDIISDIDPQLADLYELLELKFHPLRLGAIIKKKLEYIESVPAYKQYAKTIRQLAFLRIIQQLGSSFQTLKISRLVEMVPFLDKTLVEKYTIRAARENYIEARIDQKYGFITFQTSLAVAANHAAQYLSQVKAPIEPSSKEVILSLANPANVTLLENTLGSVAKRSQQSISSTSTTYTSSSFEAQRLRHKLSEAARNLNFAVQVIIKPNMTARQESKKKSFELIAAELDSEHKRILKRRKVIEQANIDREHKVAALAKQREIAEHNAKERAAAEEKERQAQKVQAAELKKQQLQQEQQEKAKVNAMKGKLEEEAEKAGIRMSEQATKKLADGKLDAQAFLDIQVKAIVAGHERTERHLKDLIERMDHLVRAKREREIPLMKEYAKKRVTGDASSLAVRMKEKAEEDRKRWDKQKADKTRLAKIQGARKALEDRVLEVRRAEAAKEAQRREEEEKKRLEEKRIEDAKRKEEEARIAAAEQAAADRVAATLAAATGSGDKPMNWAQRKSLEAGGAPMAGGRRPGPTFGGPRDNEPWKKPLEPTRSETVDTWKKGPRSDDSSSSFSAPRAGSETWKKGPVSPSLAPPERLSAPSTPAPTSTGNVDSSSSTATPTKSAYKTPAQKARERQQNQ